ncbi:MAG: hypothetical protein WDM80_04475 [Limisphaerales bacterium]
MKRFISGSPATAGSQFKINSSHNLLRRYRSWKDDSGSGGGKHRRLTAEFLPERVGRYRSVVKLPDGTTQESRFVVFTENLEETEVATDALYLRRLCEASGGRIIEPAELPRLLKELTNEKADLTPKIIVQPVWNEAWVFYLAGLLFGLDWFLRRRWGLC